MKQKRERERREERERDDCDDVDDDDDDWWSVESFSYGFINKGASEPHFSYAMDASRRRERKEQ